MRTNLTRPATALIAALAIPAVTQAQSHQPPRLHVNPRWSECAFQLDPSLSRAAWKQFTREAGLVTYFRPLVDARPMGRGQFELSALSWQTGIDDHDSAWNDTFVHPDSAHWLFEGSGLSFPGLMARAGITDRLDVGAYLTKNVNSNYGFYGGQAQYAFGGDTTRKWSAAARMSFVSMFGPEDVALNTIGADLVASRTFTANRWASVSPYVGVSTYLSGAREKSNVVSLPNEYEGGSHATFGAVGRLSVLTIAAEYSAAKVSSRSLKVGVSF